MKKPTTPTVEQFKAFENAYKYFNKVLFNNQLPNVILNLSRKSKAMGFVAPFRWRQSDGQIGTKGTIHELSINPEILSMSAIEVYSTLVHEQCHIWQYELGEPSRSGYHNKEWALKMKSVGLIPSHTGKEGGNMTGQNISDYPQTKGVFLAALEKMPEKFKLPFVSIEGDYLAIVSGQVSIANLPISQTNNGDANQLPKPPKKKNKTKYTCSCGNNAWGKPNLNIICGDCQNSYIDASTIIKEEGLLLDILTGDDQSILLQNGKTSDLF